MITEFYIDNLFNEKNIKVRFDGMYKIVVAENGCGKTTILNIFHALLNANIAKLRKFDFKKIGVKFSNGIDISFEKDEFDIDLKLTREHPLFNHLAAALESELLFELIDESRNPLFFQDPEYIPPVIYKVSEKIGMSVDMLKKYIWDFSGTGNSKNIKKSKKINISTQEKFLKIKNLFPYRFLYLPTYRRVEEDIRVFGSISKKEFDKNVSINFGMSDVKESIKLITAEILTSSVEWFSKINGQMLSQLVDGFKVTEEMKISVSSQRSVKIVLERIGKNISKEDKEKILNLVNNGGIQKNHDPLVYFVANLLAVYEQQKENDEAIQQFTKVSNKYLRDKEIIYNESNVTIDIVRKKNSATVDFETLSSGEKQIISLFALLYLEKKKDLAIFFDEPELSLSVEWQKTLLPDIIGSGKCQFLFCTTHSPFIFENSLESITVDLSKYIEEV